MKYHYQNLNEKGFRKLGTIFKHGRAWWWRLNWEWHFGTSDPGLAITKEDSGNLQFRISIGLFQFFLRINEIFKMYVDRTREISIRFNDGCIWLRFWGDPNDSKFDHHWILSWQNWIFGKKKFSKEIVESKETVIPMPEGCYKAIIALERCTWKRSRWFAKSYLLCDVKIKDGIPFQGKGENSYDMDDDAMYGLSCQASSIEDAIGKTVTSALKERKRYGETAKTCGKILMAEL